MKWIFTILVSIISFLSLAQNYSGQYPGAMHFYSVNNGNQIISIREDSSYFTGTELTRLQEPILRNVSQEFLNDSICLFWGSECIWKKDGITLLGNKIKSTDSSVTYFNYLNDSININFQVSINDTQTVYSNIFSDLKIDYKCISKDTLSIFGQLDSVIVFSIQTKNFAGNYFSSILTGEQIIYTKNLGLIEGFALDYFPDTLNKIDLEGIRNPNYGFDGLTFAELYDFQIFDQIEIYFSAGPYNTSEFIDIINRIDNLIEVEYTANRIYETRSWNFTTQIYDTIRDTSIVQFSKSKNDYIDESDYNYLGYRKNQSILNGCYSGTTYEQNNYFQCEMMYCPSLNCFGSLDCFQAQFYDEKFISGVGVYYGLYTSTDMGTPTGFKNLKYLKKNGIECGSSYFLSYVENDFITNFSIFPNPTSNLITLQTEQIIHNGKIQLTDISGRVVQQINFNQSLQIDLSHFSNGIYLIKLFSDNNLLSVQKLVKE